MARQPGAFHGLIALARLGGRQDIADEATVDDDGMVLQHARRVDWDDPFRLDESVDVYGHVSDWSAGGRARCIIPWRSGAAQIKKALPKQGF